MGRIMNLIGGGVMAVGASQFPEFSQQYVQRLGGMVDGLRPVVEQFDARADAAGLERQSLLDRLIGNADPLVAQTARDTEGHIQRYERLDAHYQKLRDASATQRLLHLNSFSDLEIAQATWSDYRGAVPIGADSWAITGGGLLAGFLAMMGLSGLASRIFRRREEEPVAEPQDDEAPEDQATHKDQGHEEDDWGIDAEVERDPLTDRS